MARRIVDSGYPLTLWARRPESLEPFSNTAAVVVSTPAEVGARSDIVGICVVSDHDVEEVLLRPDGVLAGMTQGGVIAIHSTVHPNTCRRLAQLAAKEGVTIIDAPVSGGGTAATEGRLLVMVGGDEEIIARSRPVWETFGHPILQMGGLGSGQVAKLVNNLVFTAQIAMALDTFEFAEQLSVNRATLAQVLANGSGSSKAAQILANAGFEARGLRQAHPLLKKDLDIVLDLVAENSLQPPAVLTELAATALARLERTDSDRRAVMPIPNRP
jgi:3-hydroxyisobutyrate dehydrogenase-like beta-hydroxyacid dehydrogenase